MRAPVILPIFGTALRAWWERLPAWTMWCWLDCRDALAIARAMPAPWSTS
jgi:hypothetical protein